MENSHFLSMIEPPIFQLYTSAYMLTQKTMSRHEISGQSPSLCLQGKVLLVSCRHSFELDYQNDDNGLLGIILLMMWMGKMENIDKVVIN